MIVCCIFKLCDILWNGWSNCCKRVLKKINSVYKLPSLNLGFSWFNTDPALIPILLYATTYVDVHICL